MDTSDGMAYDARSSSSTQDQQSAISQRYIIPLAQGAAPIIAMSAHHYQPQAFMFVPYCRSPPMAPIDSPFPQEFQEHLMCTATAQDESTGYVMPPRRASIQPDNPKVSSPARTETTPLAQSLSTSPNVRSRTITYNETINAADGANFDTDIDMLMRAIQAKTNAKEQGEIHVPAHTRQSSASACEVSMSGQGPKPKKWICDGPNCNKRFVQKTHLDIHQRTHTGIKPYTCTVMGCGLKFSQQGNLKAHIRRHTGEKPFSCSICGRAFAQRSNVRSHEETHKGLKPFDCKLDDCNRSFSQLGNMKTHQNNFHKETLRKLIRMHNEFAEMDKVPKELAMLFEYFQKHYKNSNKGIKGRGKARTETNKTITLD